MKASNYSQALKEYVVQTFVAEHARAPNAIELREELIAARRKYPNLEQIGFAGHLVSKPSFASVSSAQDENLNRQAIYRDITLVGSRVGALSELLENSFRSFYGMSRVFKKNLDQIEARLDNVLLLVGSTDAFVYGIEENFVVQDKIDFVKSTVSAESGFCTLGRSGFGLVNLDDATITYSTTGAKGITSFQNTSPIESLKSDDGNFWEHLVYTDYKQGRVSTLIDVGLAEPQFISEVRFTANTGGINSRIKATVFYSLDNKVFKVLEPQEVILTSEENVFNIGLDAVQKVRIMLSKEAYDNSTAINNQYVYTFSVDSIKLYSKSYSGDGESVLYAGPYDILDEEGNSVSFSKATCDVCVSAGETSAVATYLSQDGVTYLPVDTSKTGSSIVTFSNGSGVGTESYLVSDYNVRGVVVEPLIDLQPNEVLLNTAISSEYLESTIRKAIVIKRNTPFNNAMGVRERVYDVDSGWNYDVVQKLYRTTVHVENPLGTVIDLGSTSAFINGIQMSGAVTLLQGYSVFETTESNFQEIPPGLVQVNQLRKADPLYPYNHKLLIEGYGYGDLFQGEKVYAGVDEYFGFLLTFVPPELFAIPENTNNYNIYTIDDSDGRGIFKVKTNKASGSWELEEFSSSWSVTRGTNNQIWFKMILTSSTGYTSPIVESVSIRVI